MKSGVLFGVRCGVLLVFLLWPALTTSRTAGASEKSFGTSAYCPVLFARFWEESNMMFLLGGFKDGTWYTHKTLPITVQGETVDLKNPPLPQNDEMLVCSTPLLSPGTTFALYTSEGQEKEPVACRQLGFSFMHVSKETMIDVLLDRNLSRPVEKLLIGVNGEWNALLAPTTRTDKEGLLTFAADLDARGNTAEVALKLTEKDESLLVYEGSVRVGGREVRLSDPMSVYVEKVQDIEAFFLDLNGDGRMEFVLYAGGPACSIEAYDLTEDAATSVFFVDLGE